MRIINPRLSSLLSYALAFLIVLPGLGLALWLGADAEPFATPLLFAAVLLSTWYGGLGSGMLAMLLSLLVLHAVILPYTASQNITGVDLLPLGEFALVALMITLLNERRVRAENALRANEERLRTVITHNADGIVIVDAKGVIRLANPAAEKILGQTAAELQGVAFGFPVVEGEITELDLSRRPGGPGVAEMRVVAIPWEGRSAFLASLRDMTQRKQLEAELRNLNAQLEQRVHERTADLQRINTDLQQVAYISAHDLMEPARMVSIYAQRLAKCDPTRWDENADSYLTALIKNAARMHAQLDDLLTYIQVETAPKPFAAINCEELLKWVLLQLQPVINQNQALITHDSLPIIHATAEQAALLFRHLIDNALKFRAAEPPRVHIRAEQQDQMWRFAVQDNGIGLAPQYAERIFGVFKRLHSREQYPGTGIGLAICKKITERHGGRIWVESSPGQGATFFFTLPAAPDSPA